MDEINTKRYEKLHSNSGMIDITNLGSAIYDARKMCKVSRIKAAAYCGVSELTFCRWENGVTKHIKQDNYNKLVDILNGDFNEKE